MNKKSINEAINSYEPYIDGLEQILNSDTNVMLGSDNGAHAKITLCNQVSFLCTRYSYNMKSAIMEALKIYKIETDGLEPSNDVINEKILSLSKKVVDGISLIFAKEGSAMNCYISDSAHPETSDSLFKAFKSAITKHIEK